VKAKAPIGRRILRGEEEYHPGDIVPYSGVYTVKHDTTHRTEHVVTAIQGKRFPPCRTCKGVTYSIAKRAIHLHDHPDYDHSVYR
jgi:hypothetical protein